MNTYNLNSKVLNSIVTLIPESTCYNLKATTQALVSYFGCKMDTKKEISFKCKIRPRIYFQTLAILRRLIQCSVNVNPCFDNTVTSITLLGVNSNRKNRNISQILILEYDSLS